MRRCVGVDRDAFAAAHWDSTPLLTRAATLAERNGSSGFADLLCADDIDALVSTYGLRAPFFRLVKDAKPVTGVTRQAVAGSRTITDLADDEAIRRAHADGATLVLQSLHRNWPPLVRFCRELAAEIGHPTQCNAYVTPAGNAQGFAYHHDTHDVFVLQVAGRKRWQVHPPVLPLPTNRQPRAGAGLVPEGQQPLLDVELQPGDALYLPRGFVHAAQTTDDRSVHLTIGLLTTTWYDVLRDVTTLAADELAFRHALPMSPLDALDADPDLAAGMLKQAAEWLGQLPQEQVRTLLLNRFGRAVRPEPLGMLAQTEAAAGVGLDSRVRPRAGLRWRVVIEADEAVLRLPDRSVRLPDYVAPAIEAAMTAPVSPRELASAGPVPDVTGVDVPGLDEPGALVLVRRLLREGALVLTG